MNVHKERDGESEDGVLNLNFWNNKMSNIIFEWVGHYLKTHTWDLCPRCNYNFGLNVPGR